jgi:hypothetical protein
MYLTEAGLKVEPNTTCLTANLFVGLEVVVGT